MSPTPLISRSWGRQAVSAVRVAASLLIKRVLTASLVLITLVLLQGCASASRPPVKVVEVAQPIQKVFIKVLPNRALMTCDQISLPSEQEYLKTAVSAKKAVEEERDRLWNMLADEFRRAAKCRASINAEVQRMEDELSKLEQEHAR